MKEIWSDACGGGVIVMEQFDGYLRPVVGFATLDDAKSAYPDAKILLNMTYNWTTNIVASNKETMEKLKRFKHAMRGWLEVDKWPDQLAAEYKGWENNEDSLKETLYEILKSL